MALTKISTGGVKDDAASQAKIADEAIDEARLQVSNAGSNGQFLQKQSGNTGGLTWAAVPTQYTHPNHSGEVTSTADGAQVIASNVVDEDNLKVSNSPTNGQLLSAQSGNTGGLTWTDPPASAPQIEATADGAIAAGDPIIVKPDGDVKKVGLAITVLNPPTVSTDKTLVTTNNLFAHELFWITSLKKFILGFRNNDSGDDFEVVVGEVTDAGAFTWGSIVQVEAGTQQGFPTFTYDTNSNKVIAAWRDTGSNTVRTAVGTISGNSISFGTVVVVETGSESGKFGLCFDSTNNKVVIVWSEDSTGYAKSAVGTVSGTSISWGTAVDVNSENSDGFSCAYDPDTQRVLLVANMQSDNQINSYVGTVSGTSISWGSETQVVSVGHDVGIVYDTENNKAVVGYRANSNDCLALVGTVTGSSTNSISWGTAASWWTSGNSGAAKIVYDDYTKRVVVQTRSDIGGSQYLWTAVGTVSGTSISFTNKGQQTSEVVYGASTAALCMAQKGQIISASRHGSLDQDTYSWRGLAGTGATDLTTENYVGIAAASASSGATATIDVSGATNSSQSSLTAGQKYYVQGDGSLGLTAATPAVFAGTAVSATKIIVNDQQPLAVAPVWELLNSGENTSAPADAGTIIEGLQTTYSDYKVIKIEFYVHFTNNTSYAGFQFKVGGSWLGGSGYHSQCEYGRHSNTNHMTQDTNSNSSITINEDSNDRCENIAGTLAWHRGPNSEDAMLTWDAKGMAYSGANYDFFLFNGAGGEAGTRNNTLQGIQWKNSNTSNIWWKVIGMK